MALLSEIKGIVRDYGFVPIGNAVVSIYKKVAEITTDSEGNYSCPIVIDSNECAVKIEKDDYFSAYNNVGENGTLNVHLMKSDQTAPDAPTFFRANDFNTGDSIILTWNNINYEYVAGYNIYRANELTSKFVKVNSELINDLSYIDTGLNSNDEYFYILEVISANSIAYRQGVTTRTAIIGPVKVRPTDPSSDISLECKLKIDSTKTNREGEKIFDGNPNTWWESKRGEGAWVEFDFPRIRFINKVYFKKKAISRGITFATLQYWNGTNWIKIQDANYIQTIDYTFENFLIETEKIRLFVNKVEPLTEAEISEVRIFGL